MTPLRPVAGVIVYVVKPVFPIGSSAHRRVLFLKRSGGLHENAWWPVGGTPKSDELPLQTALRELEEETALTPVRLFNFGLEIPHADPARALATYVAMVNEDAIVTLNYEHSAYNWISGEAAIDQVPDHSKQYLEHLDRYFIKSNPDAAWEIDLGSVPD